MQGNPSNSGNPDRPNVLHDWRLSESERSLDRWFDTSAYRLPAQYSFGNGGRVHPTLRADFVENLDFSIFKRFQLKENVAVEFRGEWFNALNHPVCGDPNTIVGNAQFGRVTAIANIPRQTQLALKFLF